MKRYFCDKCGKHIDSDYDGFAQRQVSWWCRGVSEQLKYQPDIMHRDGYEEFMMCATCANETFGGLDGMEDA